MEATYAVQDDSNRMTQDTIGLSKKEFELIQEYVKTRMQQNQTVEYESFDGYELPPRTQFSMLKKPAVTFKYGKLSFNMAAIRMFKGVRHILPMVNASKKKFAIVPCTEEESASIEWARKNRAGKWVNKEITAVDFIEKIFKLMDWDRECRYKVLGRVAASERGLILVFEMEEAIMFAPKRESYIDPKTGKEKKRQVKYYPDSYKNCIGRSYSDYEEYRQQSQFEDFADYKRDLLASADECSINEKAEENPKDMPVMDTSCILLPAQNASTKEKNGDTSEHLNDRGEKEALFQ